MEADINEPKAPDLDRLMKQIDGYQVTAVIYTMIKVGAIDGLASGARAALELAAELEISAPHLTRLLRAASSVGLCREGPAGVFALSSTGEALRLESSSPLRQRALLAVEQYWSAWANLAHSVKTGQCAFEDVHGMLPWRWRSQNAGASALFNTWLSKETTDFGRALAEQLNLKGARKVADIGGGDGALLALLLSRHPALTGILFEQPGVIEEARRKSFPSDVIGRLQMVPGDFFAGIPVSADVYVLKSVLHDWDDDRALVILGNCRRVMEPGTRLFMIERALSENSANDVTLMLLDIHMMAVTSGRERSLTEIAALLDKAGFAVPVAVHSIAGFAVFEARPATRL